MAVVGGGIVGLSTAASVKERHPDWRVVLLERGLLPTGASTKNAGFACFGSLTEMLVDLATDGEELTLEMTQKRIEGLHLLRQRLGDADMDFHQWGGYELLFEPQAAAVEEIARANRFLRPIFDTEVFASKPELISTFGFSPTHVKHLVFNPFEGQIDTGKTLMALLQHVQRLGVVVLTGAEVTALHEHPGHIELQLQNPAAQAIVPLQAAQVAVCTNAFTRQLLPHLDVQPGRGQVLITEPIPNLPFRGTFHFDEGYYYFRNFGDRVLFGGGRNLDKQGETTTALALNPLISKELDRYLQEVILPGRTYQVDRRWAGIMAFGGTKKPIVGRHSDRMLLGVRMGGMGVALGSLVGKQIADLL